MLRLKVAALAGTMALLCATVALAPAPVRGGAPTDFWISGEAEEGVGLGTSCTAPDVQYDPAGGLNAALEAIYEEDGALDSGDTIHLCDIEDEEGADDYTLTDFTSLWDATDGAEPGGLTITGEASDASTIIINANSHTPFHFEDTSLVLSNMTIENAESINPGASIWIELVDSAAVTLLLDTVVIDNSGSDSSGGAVWVDGSVEVDDSELTDNGADDSGGAIYATGDVTVQDSHVSSNQTLESGGAIYSESEVHVVSSLFEGNDANGGTGGAIHAEDNVFVDDSTFIENHAHETGGAINGTSDVAVSNSAFTDNDAIDAGGAIWTYYDFEALATTFDSNVAGGDGGAVYVQEPDETGLLVEDSIFKGNEGWNGGALYMFNTAPAVIRQSVFSGNVAGGHGGALSFNVDLDTLEDSQFTNNSADGAGGAVYVENGVYDAGEDGDTGVRNNVFTGNTADAGGALYVGDLYNDTVITSNQFLRNRALADGGGMHLGDSLDVDAYLALVSRNVLTLNTAGQYGGGMFLQFHSTSTLPKNVTRNTFKRNSARSGGALIIDGLQGCGSAAVSPRAAARHFRFNTYSRNRGGRAANVGAICTPGVG